MNLASLVAMPSREGWSPRPLKAFISANDSGVWGQDADGGPRDTIVLRSTDVALDGGWRIEDPAVRSLSPSERRASALRRGDLIVVKSSGSKAHLGKVALVTNEVEALAPSFSNFMQRLRPLQTSDPRYLWYLLNSRLGREQMVLLGTTSTGLQNLSGGILGSVICPGPPVSAQHSIADYLDVETARIDALIEAKRRSVELLSERRAAAVGLAVFGSARGEAGRSESLVGDMVRAGGSPGTWRRMPLKRIATMRAGKAITSEGITDAGEYPVFGGNGPRGFTTQFTHDGEYVLIGRQGALCGNVNYASGRFWASEHAVVVAADSHTDLRWLGELLRTLNLNRLSQSAAQPGLSVEVIESIEVAIPPSDEQRAIGDYLDAITSEAASLTSVTIAQIDLLLERREALITAAVTGQLEIPGVAA